MQRPTIGLLLYGNPDHYPPTVNAAHLLAERYEVVVVGRNQGQSDRTYPPTVRVHRLGPPGAVGEREAHPATQKLAEYSAFVLGAARRLADASLVYAYDSLGYAAARLAFAKPGRERPIFFHSHELEGTAKPLTLLGMAQQITRAQLGLASALVFPDPDRARLFDRWLPLPSRPYIVPNFPMRALFPRPDLPALLPGRWAGREVLYRGSIGEASAMRESVSAVAQLPEPTRLTFVGFLRPEVGERLRAHIQGERMEQRARYAGLLPYRDLQPLTERAAVGLAMYKDVSEGLAATASASNKIYEYAACGVPAVVSDLPGYRVALGGERWVRFANPSDPASIATAIRDLLSDEGSYRAASEAARRAFEERFNYEAAFAPLAKAIQESVPAR